MAGVRRCGDGMLNSGGVPKNSSMIYIIYKSFTLSLLQKTEIVL